LIGPQNFNNFGGHGYLFHDPENAILSGIAESFAFYVHGKLN